MVVAGGLASVALGEFPGVTWFVVRVLLTVSFLLVWWGFVGFDVEAGVVGGIVLAFGWAVYSQFVGPIGLPDTPLRILDPAPPPAVVRWLDYRELWLISLPIYLVVMTIALPLAGRGRPEVRRRAVAAAAIVPLVLLTTALTVQPEDRGVSADFSASGDVTVSETQGTGHISISATDMGNRVTPLPPHDRLTIDSSIGAGAHTVDVQVDRAMIEDPLGEETTWWGVAFGVDYRDGATGENYRADLVGFGLGTVRIDGTALETTVPVKVVASRQYGLELTVGSDAMPLPEENGPVVEATWSSFSGESPSGPAIAHYIGGGAVLVALIALALLLGRRTTIGRQTRDA